MEIHDTKDIEPKHIPDGSTFRYYKQFVVQDLKIASYNIRYKLKVCQTPDGNYVSGTLPEYLNGGHYGPLLIRFILYQHYHCLVTQPLLLEQLHELDIDISKGTLNNILIENKDRYHISFLAGIDLISGHVHAMVANRHRSREFVEFLKMIDSHYPQDIGVRINAEMNSLYRHI